MASPGTEAPGGSQVFVVRTLSAAHRIVVDGRLEPLHGHDFQVTAWFTGESDPLTLAEPLDELLAGLADRNLELVAPEAGEHPSAERIARQLLDALLHRGLPATRVTVRESPGCWATCTTPI